MADTLVAEWRTKLQPWLSVLRRFGLSADLGPIPTVSDISEMWLSINAPQHVEDSAEKWMMIAEALEILELLARVHHRAAWALLFEVAGIAPVMEQFGDHLFISPDVLPRFLVLVDDEGLLEEGQPTIFGLLRFVVETSEVSDDYNEVKQCLEDQYADHHDGVAFDRETHGRVKMAFSFDVGMDYDNESAIQYVFKQIADLVFSYKDPSLILPGMGPDSDLEDDEDGVEENEATDSDTNVVAVEANTAVAGATNGDEAGTGVRPATRERVRAPFEFDSYRILLSSSDIVPNLVLYLISQASKSGMPLSHFSITSIARSELHHSVIGDFLINQIVPWADCRVERGIRDLKFNMGMFDAAAVRVFCSAIVCSHSLRRFAFQQTFGERDNPHGDVAGFDVWWPWLAYALFSRDATNNIHSVLLNVHGMQSMAVMKAVREVLGSDDPAKLLYQPEESARSNDEGTPSQPMAAVLKKTANLRLGHYSAEGDAPALTIGEPGVTYRVLRNVPEEDFIEFLLPGSGVAWTDRSELLELRPLFRRTVHTIRRLTLKLMDKVALQTTIALLELIGEPLERITIDDGFTDTAFLQQLLRCCPNLKRLDLKNTDFQSFDWLCRSNDVRSPKLETLTINYYTARAPLDWSLLFNSLSDPTHPLTRSLRELAIISNEVHNDTTQDAQEEIVKQYADMLSKNMRLTRCEMTTHVKPAFNKYKTQFHSHHLELVAVKEAPLPMPETLAFLSAETPSMETQDEQSSTELSTKRSKTNGGSTTTSARYNLDPEALRSILEFAAVPKRRLCKIEHQLWYAERFLAEHADMVVDLNGENADDVPPLVGDLRLDEEA